MIQKERKHTMIDRLRKEREALLGRATNGTTKKTTTAETEPKTVEVTEEVTVTYIIKVPYQVTVTKSKSWDLMHKIDFHEFHNRKEFRSIVRNLVDKEMLYVEPPISAYMDRAAWLPNLDGALPDELSITLAHEGQATEIIQSHVEQ